MSKRNWVMAVAATIGLLSATVTPTTASASTKDAASSGGVLTISNAEFLWTCGFSPFNPSSNFLSVGAVYEPLMFVDTLDNAKVTPMLATASTWSDGNKVLTFTVRKGVTWTDGQPFSAADVAYTFDLLKDNPALDLNTVWSVLSSVAQKGDDVVMTFKTPAVPYFYYIADQVGIVPEHVWSKVGNPLTYKDANPVGTGPFTVKSCTPQNVSYVRNDHYWQPGLPKILGDRVPRLYL